LTYNIVTWKTLNRREKSPARQEKYFHSVEENYNIYLNIRREQFHSLIIGEHTSLVLLTLSNGITTIVVGCKNDGREVLFIAKDEAWSLKA